MNELVDLIESLSRETHDFREEMNSRFNRLEKEMRERTDRIEQVTRRHSTSITSGTFSIAGLNKAIERVEGLVHDRDHEITELRDRVRVLEEKLRGGKGL